MDDRDASPLCKLLNFDLLEWSEGFARIACQVTPDMMNRNGIVHGGVLMALLDEASGTAGAWCSVPGNERRSVTVDLNCRFAAPGRSGRLTAEAKVVGGGRSLYFCQAEVRDEAGTLLAFASSTHRYRAGGHLREGVPVGSAAPPREARGD